MGLQVLDLLEDSDFVRKLDVYKWMVLNVDRLVEAIRLDGGKLDGPNAAPLFEEAWSMTSPGKSRDRARDLLRIKLENAGLR